MADLTTSLKDDDVDLKGLTTQLLFAIIVAQSVYNLYQTPLVITSLNDSVHSNASLHWSGNAVDIRTRNLPVGVDPQDVADRIDDALGFDYDVIYHNDHIHIEYQPKFRG